MESWKLGEGVESVSTSLLLGKEEQHQEVWSGKGETEDQAGPGQGWWWQSGGSGHPTDASDVGAGETEVPTLGVERQGRCSQEK